MKKLLFLLVGLLCYIMAIAQVPARFNYQAVLRDSEGKVLVNQSAILRVGLTNQDGTISHYTETHDVTTNAIGLVNIVIGLGQNATGSIVGIPWSSQEVFLNLEIKLSGAADFTWMGRQPLQSVPYALFAADGNQGPQGVPGDSGISIVWLGQLNDFPLNPQLNWAFYNKNLKSSYIYNGNQWDTLAVDGVKGADGVAGLDGQPGANGLSIEWLGELPNQPTSATINQAYYNKILKASFIFDGNEWNTLAVDGSKGADGLPGAAGTNGLPGQDGVNGLSLEWLGTFATPPTPDTLNQAYHNMQDSTSYIWDGNAWQILTSKGSTGAKGETGLAGNSGQDGLSIEWLGELNSQPVLATKNQAYYNKALKLSYVYDGVEWDTLSVDGKDGIDGVNGLPLVWLGMLNSQPAVGSTNQAYYDKGKRVSYVYNGSSWDTLSVDGINGKSVEWLGSKNSEPVSPLLNQAYYNISDKTSYVYDGTSWQVLTIDGTDGFSIEWLSASSTEPVATKLNQAYYNTDSKKSYIWNGSTWEIIAQDGLNGSPGSSILWLGNAIVHPSPVSVNNAYYNTVEKVSFVYNGTSWDTLAKDGSSIIWKGEFGSPLPSPKMNWAYYNNSDKQSYIFDGTEWKTLAKDGTQGVQGVQGLQGIKGDKGDPGTGLINKGAWSADSTYASGDYVFAESSATIGVNSMWICQDSIKIPTADQPKLDIRWVEFEAPQGEKGDQGDQGIQGLPGESGKPIVWKGSFTVAPSSPELNWAYYNSSTKKSFVWDGDSWEQMVQDGANGSNGSDGISIQWLGNLSSPPGSPSLNNAYYNTADKKAYIYNGSIWEIIAQDGAAGAAGVSISWAGSFASAPSPALNKAYYNTTQKKSFIYDGDSWETLSQDGSSGSNGISIQWQGSSATPPASPQLNWAYYNTADKKSYIYNGSTWLVMTQDGATGATGAQGPQGVTGLTGPAGSNGISITWLGELPTAPISPSLNNAYYNTTLYRSYVWDGDSWEILAKDGATGTQGPQGPVGPQGPEGPLVSGTSGQTLRHDGSSWVATSTLYNDGTNVGIGTTVANQTLSVRNDAGSPFSLHRYSSTSGHDVGLLFKVFSGTTNYYYKGGLFFERMDVYGNGNLHFATTNATTSTNVTKSNARMTISSAGNVGIGTTSPTQLLDVSGTSRFRGLLYDYYNSTGTSGQVLTRGTSGIEWQTPSANVSGSGTSGKVAYWSGTSTLSSLSNVTYVNSLEVKGEVTADPDAPIFEVKNSAGEVIFGVYQEGVRINIKDAAITKGVKGGFAVGGLTNQTKAGPVEYFRITPDSARIYVKEEAAAKGVKGGFAVGGLTNQTKAVVKRDLLFIAPDSARIYVDTLTSAKGVKGGFAVGGLTNQNKASSSQFLQLNTKNYLIGKDAGKALTTGVYNSFIGHLAGMKTQGGRENIFIGLESGYENISGSWNTFLGFRAGKMNTGSDNTFIGFLAGSAHLNEGGNVYIGSKAGRDATHGKQNVYIGESAGLKTTYGKSNVFLGYQSGYNTTGNSVDSTYGSFNVFMGYQSGFTNTTGRYNVFLGYKSGYLNVDGKSNTFIGHEAGYANTSGGQNVFMGNYAGQNHTINGNNVYIGYRTGQGNGADESGEFNVYIGSFAAGWNTTGSSNVILGRSAGLKNTGGSDNVIIGTSAGYNNGIGYRNVIVGRNSGGNSVNSYQNVFIGDSAGYNNSSFRNVFIGNEAGADNTSYYNVFIGYKSGKESGTANYSTFVGHETGKVTTGANNSFYGAYAGSNNTTGQRNTFIGYNAGSVNTIGNYNTYLGTFAGMNSTGNLNVFIGYLAGSNETGSGKLIIANNATSPLIYGDFTTGNIGFDTETSTYDLTFGGDETREIGMDRRTTSTYTGNPLYLKAGGATSGQADKAGGNLYLTSGIATGTGSSNIYFQTATAGTTGTSDRNPDTKMTILGNGNLGIGTTSPAEMLHIKDATSDAKIRLDAASTSYAEVNFYNGTTYKAGLGYSMSEGHFYIYSGGNVSVKSGNLGIGNTAPGQKLDITAGNGRVQSGYSWLTNSDIRYKKNISTLTNSLTKILQLRGVRFDLNEDSNTIEGKGKHIGFIAQELELQFPEFVVTEENGFKSVSYDKMTAVLVEAIKEQQNQIEALKAKNAELESKNNEIEKLRAEIEEIRKLIGK